MSDTLVIRLSELYEQVAETVDAAVPILTDTVALAKVEEICHNIRNRGVIRFLMSCLVAKIYLTRDKLPETQMVITY